MSLPRRDFLRIALAQVGIGAVGSLLGCRESVRCELADDADDDWKDLGPEGRVQALLDGYFGDGRWDIEELGRAYAATLAHPKPALERFVCRHVEAAANRREAVASVTAALNQDFTEWNTVLLHGWVLAETELLLCALAVS